MTWWQGILLVGGVPLIFGLGLYGFADWLEVHRVRRSMRLREVRVRDAIQRWRLRDFGN